MICTETGTIHELVAIILESTGAQPLCKIYKVCDYLVWNQYVINKTREVINKQSLLLPHG